MNFRQVKYLFEILLNKNNILKIKERDGLPPIGGFSSTEKYIEINFDKKSVELKEKTTLINQNVPFTTKIQYPEIKKIGKRVLSEEELEKLKNILNEKINENEEYFKNTNLQYLLEKDDKIYVIDECENLFLNNLFDSIK